MHSLPLFFAVLVNSVQEFVKQGGASELCSGVGPADSPQAGAGGAAIAVRETLQLGQVHVLLDACVVGRVELLEPLRAGAGGQVLHRGAHRVGAALCEPNAGVCTLAQSALLHTNQRDFNRIYKAKGSFGSDGAHYPWQEHGRFESQQGRVIQKHGRVH